MFKPSFFAFSFFVLNIFFFANSCKAQPEVDRNEIQRIIQVLAADSMEGRKIFTPGIEKASRFIQEEFTKIGLMPLAGGVHFMDTFSVSVNSEGGQKVSKKLNNIVGILPGKSRMDEYVIFSAHYDHIGILEPVNGDSIANGADDDASGTTAVIALANYFKKLNNNERTLVFVAFTAEEVGGHGSKNFAQHFNPDKIVAMFNIEMIGKEAKFGSNTAFITGFEKSDFGTILQKNVKGTDFSFHPDPYTEQNLFYRSDNATLAKLGVPAHTISTVQIDKDIYYHTVDDELETIAVDNMVNTIKGIIQGSKSIISGRDTPTRVEKL